MTADHTQTLALESLVGVPQVAQWYIKNPPVNTGDAGTWIRSLGWEDPLEEGMATHSSILTWRIPHTENPGGL